MLEPSHSILIRRPDLSIKLDTSNALYPVIVRATVLSLLRIYLPPETSPAYEAALVDDEAQAWKRQQLCLHTHQRV